MLQRIHFILIVNIGMIFLGHSKCFSQTAYAEIYLNDLKTELNKKWPQNRTINLDFYGHSVPAGYWHNSEVHTLDYYPHIVLEKIKKKYPYAVVNARQVESLSKEFQVGLANVLPLFQQIFHKNGTLIEVMSHVNHPNRLGHEIMANEIFKWF